VRGKLTKAEGTDLDITDHTAFVNNALHSFFSQCNISLNDVRVTQTSDFYHYRAYLETILSYGSDAAKTHLTNAYWYIEDPDMLPCVPTKAESNNKGFISRWDRCKQSK
jgi:hypothetical protein